MDDPWKTTVGLIFDELHLGEYSIFKDNPLARELVALIEERHWDWFCKPIEPDDEPPEAL